MSRKAANIISAQVIMKPNCVLGLAPAAPRGHLYKQLVEVVQQGRYRLLRGHDRQPGRVPRPAEKEHPELLELRRTATCLTM